MNEQFSVQVDKIDIIPEVERDSYNPVTYRRLKADLKKNGVINPIHVIKKKGTRFECFGGQTRLRAWKELGHSEIPVILHNIGRDKAIELGLKENDLREAQTAFDWNKSINMLRKEKSMTFRDLAEMLDKDESTLKRLSQIHNLPLEVKNRILEGSIPWSNAYYLLDLPKEDDMVEACEYIIRNHLKQNAVIDLVKSEDIPQDTDDSLLINREEKPRPKARPDTTWAKGLDPSTKDLVIKYAVQKNVSLKEARDFFEGEA